MDTQTLPQTPIETDEPIVLTVDEASGEWRASQLQRAGYPAEAVARLAPRGEIDLHQACLLLKQGCSVETALRILL